MNEEKKFVVMIPVNDGFYLSSREKGEMEGLNQVLNESQVFSIIESFPQQNCRIFEIIERKVETKKVLV